MLWKLGIDLVNYLYTSHFIPLAKELVPILFRLLQVAATLLVAISRSLLTTFQDILKALFSLTLKVLPAASELSKTTLLFLSKSTIRIFTTLVGIMRKCTPFLEPLWQYLWGWLARSFSLFVTFLVICLLLALLMAIFKKDKTRNPERKVYKDKLGGTYTLNNKPPAEECPICLEKYKDQNEIIVLPCFKKQESRQITRIVTDSMWIAQVSGSATMTPVQSVAISSELSALCIQCYRDLQFFAVVVVVT
eukprot:TRINITY_DN120834_c0_g1_i1.p1 TRINITY_DN120834_c0_g1~~TRINITY_DN120834_c0_g1_i1.p1  ORF type:complete len:278 (+),score=-7.28 TRINITY_DN120834_c0_g1_i1:88-834(+)